MIIKKNKNKNQYAVQDGIYVRNFLLPNIQPFDLNKFTSLDYELLSNNEIQNSISRLQKIEDEQIIFNDVVIVSDGCFFEERINELGQLPKETTIIATNGALKKWTLLGANPIKRNINYYFVNNPYEECISFLPQKHKYFPKCLFSTKTNPNFIKNYLGNKYSYLSTENSYYSGPCKNRFLKTIDDYRNPICGAFVWSILQGAKSVTLFCCDAAFKEKRPAAISVGDYWQYPQQNIFHVIIDLLSFWSKSVVNIFDYSIGIKYKNITNIFNLESRLVDNS